MQISVQTVDLTCEDRALRFGERRSGAMRFTLCEKCKYNFDGECEFYSMGSGNDVDKPCRVEEEDVFSDSVMDNLRVGEESVGEIKLKSCPFCGGEAHLWTWNGGTRIDCKNWKDSQSETHFVGIGAKTREEAIRLWNRRVNDE